MYYWELPPKEMRAFIKKLKKDYGLVISMQPVKAMLDESKYGKGWNALKETHVFKLVTKDDDGNPILSHITIQNGNGSEIIAVTKKQYGVFKNSKIVSVPYGWFWGRIESAIAQISHKYNLINPIK